MSAMNNAGRDSDGKLLNPRPNPRLSAGPARMARLKTPIALDRLKGVDAGVRENADL